MSIKLKHLAVATLAASLSGVAIAGDYKSEHGESMSKTAPDFSQLDNDNNGMVSRTELRNADAHVHTEKLTEKWSELDTNQDGNLDRSEFARFEPVSEEGEDAYEAGKDYGVDHSKSKEGYDRDIDAGDANYDAGMESPR